MPTAFTMRSSYSRGLLNNDAARIYRRAARLLLKHNATHPPAEQWGMCAAIYAAARKEMAWLQDYAWARNQDQHGVALLAKMSLLSDLRMYFIPRHAVNFPWLPQEPRFWYRSPLRGDDTEARCLALLLAAEIRVF